MESKRIQEIDVSLPTFCISVSHVEEIVSYSILRLRMDIFPLQDTFVKVHYYLLLHVFI